MATRAFDSPLGRLVLDAESDALTGVRRAAQGEKPQTEGKSAVLAEAARQLDRYFAGRLKRFDLRIKPAGSSFQQGVWKAMRSIPWGKTGTYGGIAMASGGYLGGQGLATKCKLLALEIDVD